MVKIDRIGSRPLNWEPYLWLFFLFDLFVPVTWSPIPVEFRNWLPATLLSLPVFLAIYVRQNKKRWQFTVGDLIPVALIAYALAPFNPTAFTYLGYAAMFSAYAIGGLVRPLFLGLLLLILYAIEISLLHQPLVGVTLLWAVFFVALSCLSGFFRAESNRKSAELRRLAAIEERERIGRDLHDLLGQTLSLIALKSELAIKLICRDPEEATREVTDVMNTARDSLKHVRAVVTGMRSVSLADEVNSARRLLESSGVAFTFGPDDSALSPDVEAVLGMVVREAATNIHRHAAASRAWIEVKVRESVILLIGDNGCGGATANGNGLKGILERVQALGGTLEINSLRGRGTVLLAHLPRANGPSSSRSTNTAGLGEVPP